jgi:replicative DNA helicase
MLIDIDAERSTLGSCFTGGLPTVYEVQEILESTDFFEERHRVIWESVARIINKKNPFDIMTVADELGNDLDKIGGRGYLIDLMNLTPSFTNAKHYAGIVKAKSIARQKKVECDETTRHLIDGGDPYEIVSKSMAADSKLLGTNQKTGIAHVKNRVMQVYDQIGERRENNGIVGIETGYRDLDYRIGGLRKGLFIILAARPAMGKTTFALNGIAKNTAFKFKIPTVFVSLEMTNDQLIEKLMVEDAGINSYMLQNTTLLKDNDWSQLGKATNNISESQLYLDDSNRIKASELANRLRRFKSMNDLGLVIVDYIQIMAPERRGDRNSEVSETSGILQGLAKELNVPIVALSQLSRDVERREDKTPMLADLRDSGTLEQDAAQVMFLYRDDYYHPNKYPPNNDPSLTNLIIAKNRFGPLGVIDFNFYKSKSKFTLLDKQYSQKSNE